MIKISQKTKLGLITSLLEENISFGEKYSKNALFSFLNEIVDLKNLPSEDSRYDNAYDDAYQHTVANDDWELDYVFLERFDLIKDDVAFVIFLESSIKSKYRKDEDEISRFVLIINSYIEKEGFILGVSDFDDTGSPIYSIKIKSENSYPDLPKNKITFYAAAGNPNWTPEVLLNSFFTLSFADGWNDYGIKTVFNLYYNDKAKPGRIHIGPVKISNGESNNTSDILPTNFTNLNSQFCSLGQTFEYYSNLKEIVGKNFKSVLLALNDVAFFPDILDKFEKNNIFTTSLIRNNNAERLLREAKYRISGYDLNKLYSFKYEFTPKYSEDSIETDFNFSNQQEYSDRIYAIIGKNGTGKTQLITSLPLDISKKKDGAFVPRAPMFSKVIAVSYSLFDNFEFPEKTSQFNYVYCGLMNEKKEPLSKRGLRLRFHKTWKKIKLLDRMVAWKNVLVNFIEKDIVEEFIIRDNSQQNRAYTVSLQGFNRIKYRLSSGQNIILYIISEIVANIRFDSLILFDEPETHLHPNAISELMNTIYELVQEFESYCIITTHSPLIIQELFSRNVYVLEKHNNFPSMRKIGVESFGQNLTILTEEVFGNKKIQKHYKSIIDELAEQGKSYEEILEELQINPERPLSLNARLYIDSKIPR